MAAIGTSPSSLNTSGFGMPGGSSLQPFQNKPAKKAASGKNCFILVAAAALFGGLWWLGNGSSHYTWPLTIASVYAHEMGHLITALLMGGKVESLHLSLMPNITLGAEGFVRYSIAPSRIRQALISGAGCYSQVLTGMIFVLAARHPRVSKALLIVCAALCAFSLIYADSLVTYAVVIVLGVIAGLAAKFLKGGLLQLFMAFSGFAIAAAMLENWRYLFSTNGSDMQHVSQYLFLPTWFWGGLAFLIGVVTILLGIWTFIMQEAPDEPSGPGLMKR